MVPMCWGGVAGYGTHVLGLSSWIWPHPFTFASNGPGECNWTVYSLFSNDYLAVILWDALIKIFSMESQ